MAIRHPARHEHDATRIAIREVSARDAGHDGGDDEHGDEESSVRARPHHLRRKQRRPDGVHLRHGATQKIEQDKADKQWSDQTRFAHGIHRQRPLFIPDPEKTASRDTPQPLSREAAAATGTPTRSIKMAYGVRCTCPSAMNKREPRAQPLCVRPSLRGPRRPLALADDLRGRRTGRTFMLIRAPLPAKGRLVEASQQGVEMPRRFVARRIARFSLSSIHTPSKGRRF